LFEPDSFGSTSLDQWGRAAPHLLRPVVFLQPDRLVHPPSWLEHIPFALWIVDALRPDRLVELGTQSGNSYAAFAQAVVALRLPTACYSIDTWMGDVRTRAHGEGEFNRWRDYHDRRFSAFSTLIRASFDEAVKRFADGSIDLLHIDGYHTFDTARHDFATWLPKMSRRGVVLIHDINVREKDVGSWRLWHEIGRIYPSFSFLHGHGLGVLGVGRDLPERITWLLDRRTDDSEELDQIRTFFSHLGRRVGLQYECSRSKRAVSVLRARLHEASSGATEPGRLETAELERERAQWEQQFRALEWQSLKEYERRDETIRELDAEARTLAGQLQRVRARRFGWRRFLERMGAGRWGLGPRGTRAGRAATVFLTAPRVLAMACRSNGARRSVRAFGRLLTSPRTLRSACVVAQSDLFDAAYYAEHYRDAASFYPPLIHYVLWGALEGRQPHALFDPPYYLAQYPDVARSRLEPLSHFLMHGASEERCPSPLFDSRYYLEMHPDVRALGINPLVHFVKTGWREGRNPSPEFDCAAYADWYEDVKLSGLNPLVHYVEIGRAQGRTPIPVAGAPLPAPHRVALRAKAMHPRAHTPPLIVCLTHVCPYPPHAGNAYRIQRMLSALQANGFCIVPVIVPLPGEDPDQEAIKKVEAQFGNVVVVDRSGGIRYSLRDVPDVLASLDHEHTPRYSAALGEEGSQSGRAGELFITDRTYCHDAAIAVMLRLHSALTHYVLFAEYVWMTRVLPLLDSRAIKVLDTIDVFSSKKEKVLKYGIRDFWLEPEEEARRVALADLVVAIQNDEREALQQLAPHSRVVTAGIDFDLVGVPELPRERGVLYVGSGNPMNVHGLREFLKFAWPKIREQVPDAELRIAGAVCNALENLPAGVEGLGRVADLDELYRTARVVINPALAGTGVKIKTVEALSHLRPIVTWPTGVEGLPRELMNLCDVVRDWFEFSSHVVSRLTTGRSEAFSSEARHVLERALSPERVYADLIAGIRELSKRQIDSTAAVLPE
jgi:methyltransferase family protein/glycosyl transferase family 1